MRARNRSGSVALDNRIKTWHFFWWENSARRSKRIGILSQYPTKASAWRQQSRCVMPLKPKRKSTRAPAQHRPLARWLSNTESRRCRNATAPADRQRVDDVKTDESRKAITVTETMIEVLKRWKQTTQFSAQEDWIFASPTQLGRLPWSADSVNDAYKKAASRHGRARQHAQHADYAECGIIATRTDRG